MDRLSVELDGSGEARHFLNEAVVSDVVVSDVGAAHVVGADVVGAGAIEASHALEMAEQRLAIPERIHNLEEFDALYEAERRTMWTFMRPSGRPSFTPALLSSIETLQSLVKSHFGPGRIPLDFIVLGSRVDGVFSYGGDLELFAQLIRDGDRAGLIAYGNRCVEISYRNITALDMPVITVGLAQGAALGGGFEALLSFDHVIAERGSTFGLPEVMFGLFPGMGAHPILSRKLGTAMADRMILSNETWSAEYLHDLGLVHQLAEPGEGLDAVRHFIDKTGKRHAGVSGSHRAMNVAAPIEMREFYRIVEIWAESALKIREHDLRMMQRLTGAQDRGLARAG